MVREGEGRVVYMIYRALSYSIAPLINLHLRWRKLRGLEHPLRWRERLGRPSVPRPPGPLFWFHAVSLGEGMAVIPVIKRCVQRRPDVNVLMTTTTASAFEVIKNLLPSSVIYQFAPLDTPTAVDTFLGYWKPSAIMLMESELWPNLIMAASKNGITLSLLNARMSAKSFRYWSAPVALQLASLMMSKFSLIVPLSNMQAIHFQLLQAPPVVIHFSGDLKYAIEKFDDSNRDMSSMKDLREQLSNRRVWLASSIHKGEEEVILEVHKRLKEVHPDIVTIIVPRNPQLGQQIALDLLKAGLSVALRSHHDKLMPWTNIYVVDTLGELRDFYSLSPIAVIGGSFLPVSTGHNISEAAAAGCAVLTGHHLGHFSHMVLDMQRLNPLSVLKVAGKDELEKVLDELFRDAKLLETRRAAAKQAFRALSFGVTENVWDLLHLYVFRRTVARLKAG